MGFRAICVALLLSVLPSAGCGTVKNLARSNTEQGGRRPFGGVEQDVWCIKKAAAGEPGGGTSLNSEWEREPRVALMLLGAADLPFSLIGDIVTWPYTMAYTYINSPVPTPPITVTNQAAIQPVPTAPATLPIPTPPAMKAPAEIRPQTSPPQLLPKPTQLP